jgi:hypothetical protein
VGGIELSRSRKKEWYRKEMVEKSEEKAGH